ncbi:MAG: hypothetical protein ACREF5_00275 [Candidatus Saccharimonadales bacterium]
MGLFDAFKGMLGGKKSANDNSNNLPIGGKVENPIESTYQDSNPVSGNSDASGTDAGSSTSTNSTSVTDTEQPISQKVGSPYAPLSDNSLKPQAPSDSNATAEETKAYTTEDIPVTGAESIVSDDQADDTENKSTAVQFSDNQTLDNSESQADSPAQTVGQEDSPAGVDETAVPQQDQSTDDAPKSST